jgi:hypothetical protein
MKHDVKQALFGVSQLYPPVQAAPVWEHMPDPLHVPTAGVKVLPVQVAVPEQVPPEAAWAHTPPVVHTPVLPQTLLVAAQPVSASDVTAEQVPSLPATLQARQVPVQAELQQNPSAQNPLAQVALPAQACPASSPVH